MNLANLVSKTRRNTFLQAVCFVRENAGFCWNNPECVRLLQRIGTRCVRGWLLQRRDTFVHTFDGALLSAIEVCEDTRLAVPAWLGKAQIVSLHRARKVSFESHGCTLKGKLCHVEQ